MGPTVPPVPPLELLDDELLLLELLELAVPQGPVGGAWQWQVSLLHHQPPKQPLA
jgi:hypothetical protein